MPDALLVGCALTAPAYAVKATMEIHVSINVAQPRLMERNAVDMVCAIGKALQWVHVPVKLVGADLDAAYLPVQWIALEMANVSTENVCVMQSGWDQAVKNTSVQSRTAICVAIMVHVTTVLAIVTRLKKMEKLSVVITVIKLAIYHIVVFMQTIRKGAVVTANVSIKFVNARRDSMANTVAKRNAQQIVTAMVSAATMACVSVT